MFKFTTVLEKGKHALSVVSKDGKEKALYIYPPQNQPEVLKILADKIVEKEFKPEAASDEAITNLLMLAPDTMDWKEASKTLVYFCLAGEKSLADILKDATAPDSPYTAEEAALCYWTKSILDVIAALKKKGLDNKAIAVAPEITALFN